MFCRAVLCVLLLAAVVLTAAAWLRSAEYDEQYTLFITAGVARPDWPAGVFTAGEVRALQAGHAGPLSIARDLQRTDVHPPLYFCAVAAWRWLAGDAPFTARLFSVLCGVAALAAVAAIAARAAVPVIPALLLTLGCYGFVYTAAIARGFALAQLLTLAGVAALLWQRALLAGLLLGAATCTNYLAAFVGIAALSWAGRWRAAIGFAAWLPADAWFFLAQRGSRAGQFPPFEWLPNLLRTGQYLAGNLFGGLPLYAAGAVRTALAGALVALAVALTVLIAWHWRRIATRETRRLFALAALAPPLGLLALGLVFDNSPIELRYLAFGVPFMALLLAGLPRGWVCVVLAVQAGALIGLMTRAETMQPARAAAAAAASLVGDGVVLLPRGNDGVGIVGAFANEAPTSLRLMVVERSATAAEIRSRVAGFSRVVVAPLSQDADSRATLPVLRAAFDDTCWHKVAEAGGALAFDRQCEERY